jgi:hypothetical protein
MKKALRVDVLDTGRQVLDPVEVVVAHAQAVARHTRVDGVSTVGDSVMQVAQGAGGCQQFRCFHDLPGRWRSVTEGFRTGCPGGDDNPLTRCPQAEKTGG